MKSAWLLFCILFTALHAADTPLEIVTATFFGSAEGDDLQSVCAAPDGTIYIAGNIGTSRETKQFGTPAKNPHCGCGFVAHLSSDGKTILHQATFAPGAVILTTVLCSERGVYVGGYGSAALEDVLKNSAGLMKKYPLTDALKQHEADLDAGKKDKIAGRPGLGREGTPCVLKLSRDLAALDGGTYLEGWQQVWDKDRVAKLGKEIQGHFQEYYWQPTHLALLNDGDVIVCHDGGYFRMWTQKDRELAQGDDKLFDRFTFYDQCDYLSRLSPDLSQRRWTQKIITPPVDPAVAKHVKEGWPLPHYSNPRTQRMRLDKDEFVYLCGWSASATSKEPYWSPYLGKVAPKSGAPVWKRYEYDPMSGGGNRMGGQVSDTDVVSLTLDDEGNILASLMADGGNTVMEWSPTSNATQHTNFEAKQKGSGFGVKLVHWWGQIHRIDKDTQRGLGGARIGPWGWCVDMAPLPNKGVLAVGRYNADFKFTTDTWWTTGELKNPNAFLRVYSQDFDQLFSTAITGVVPFELTRISETRYAWVGRADDAIAPTKDALNPKHLGKTDGYLMILDFKK